MTLPRGRTEKAPADLAASSPWMTRPRRQPNTNARRLHILLLDVVCLRPIPQPFLLGVRGRGCMECPVRRLSVTRNTIKRVQNTDRASSVVS